MTLRLPLAALLAAATALPALAEVNVYSSRQPELIEPLTQAFTEATGIEVNLAYIDDGVVERLQAEGDRSPADLVFTVDIANLSQIVDAGVTVPVESEVLQANVPDAYHDPDGHWWGLTTRARVAYASRDRVADGEVTTYEDLASEKWRGRICTRSGSHPYNLALLAGYILHHGEDAARDWAQGIKDNLARAPQGNDRAQIKAVWAGECDIALGNTYYMGLMLKDEEQKQWADSVRIVFPAFENGGTHVNVSGVAMVKSAPHPEDALKLMEFLTSPEGQELYAEINNEYPIAPGTQASELVQSWGEFTPDEVNLMDLAQHRAAALRIINEIDYDAGS